MILALIYPTNAEKKVMRESRQYRSQYGIVYKKIFTPHRKKEVIVLRNGSIEEVLQEFHDSLTGWGYRG